MAIFIAMTTLWLHGGFRYVYATLFTSGTSGWVEWETGSARGRIYFKRIEPVMRSGGDLPSIARSCAKMLTASAAMLAACPVAQHLPFYPHSTAKLSSALQLLTLMTTGAAVYFGACYALGLDVVRLLLPKRKRPA